MTPAVTLLLAVHNGGAYLREAVDSVLAQTYEDFELLVVDDASDDDSPAYLASLNDRRVRILRNTRNLGQVPSLNRGLEEARGRYVARLDADDVMLPRRLELQTAILDKEDRVALVGTWMVVIDDRGRRWGTSRGRIDSYSDFVSAILADRIPFGHPSVMFRRDVVRTLGGYDESLAPSEDKDLYRRLALERYDARVIPQPLVRYRRHEGQLSQLHMARQLATDREGQERFLAQLAPDLPSASLRLLLAGNGQYWTAAPVDDLERFLEGLSARLRLNDAERAAVAQTIATCCVRTLLSGWSSGSAVEPGRASAPLAFVKGHGGAAERLVVAAQPAIRATRPLGVAVARSQAYARRSLRASGRLATVRAAARRSRALRRVYTALLGFELLDERIDGVERVDMPREPRS